MENNNNNSLVVATSNKLDAWKPLITSLVSDKTCGVKSEGDAYLVLLKAHELGIGFTNALAHVHIIKNKVGIDIHIIKAILSNPKSGVQTTRTFNYEPIYRCILYNSVQCLSTELPETAIRVLKLSGNPQIETLVANGKIPYRYVPDTKDSEHSTPVDFITQYVFKRTYLNIKDEWETREHIETFKRSDAIRAQLMLDSTGQINKDSAWFKYEPLMIDHRCFTFGARAIASDLLMGTSSYDELLEVNGFSPSEITEDGTIISITDKNGKRMK